MFQLKFLRVLLEQQQYAALHAACMDGDLADPAVQVLLALACAHLGRHEEAVRWRDQALARQGAMDVDTRVDLAALFMVRQEVEAAAATLEAAQQALAHAGRPEHALLLARLVPDAGGPGRRGPPLVCAQCGLATHSARGIHQSGPLMLVQGAGRSDRRCVGG